MKPALTTTDLQIGYSSPAGKNILFDGLNLQLHTGQLVCFMGPNGIGKSSLIRTLAGLQRPLAGQIKFDALSGNRAEQLSVVLTDRINSANMTVYDLVAFGRYPYVGWRIDMQSADEQMIYQAIRHVHIGHLSNTPLYELSDGQLQMAMIARAIAQDTPVILLDEPTAHLDLNNRVEIMRLLKKLTKSMNKAILVSTHELDLALQTADFIWLTSLDKRILTGIPEDLVLDGSFDKIFQFKGFDLKTGKVEHQPDKGITLSLTGAGYEYLWTKNALERNGYQVVEDRREIHIEAIRNKDSLTWLLSKRTSLVEVNTIEALLQNL